MALKDDLKAGLNDLETDAKTGLAALLAKPVSLKWVLIVAAAAFVLGAILF